MRGREAERSLASPPAHDESATSDTKTSTRAGTRDERTLRRMTSTFDPFEPGEAQNAWPLLAELRKAGPVAAVAGGMHYVTQHEACRAVMRDTESFSNASGMKAPGVEVPLPDRILGELDPPHHTTIRRVMVTA